MRLLAALLNVVISSTITGVLAYFARPTLSYTDNPDTTFYIIFGVLWIGLLFLGWHLSKRLLKN